VTDHAAPDDLRQKVWDGRRIDRAEARRLFTLPLEEPAKHVDLIVQLSFTAADDRQFEAKI